MGYLSKIRFTTVCALIVLISGITVANADSVDLFALQNQVKKMKQQLDRCKGEVRSLKAVIVRMKGRPTLVDAVQKKNLSEQQQTGASVPDKESARKDVCNAVDEYAAKIRKYAKEGNTDVRWDNMRRAFADLEKVLNKYGDDSVLDEVRRLTLSIKYDVHQGLIARATKQGNEAFRRAVSNHTKKLNELRKVCDE